MLSWPSSHRIRYRGDGSPRTTSSTTPERWRRSDDKDSATTRLPTSKGMLTPSVFVLAEHRRRQASVTTTSGRSHHPNVARPRWPPVGGWMFRRRAVGPQRSCRRSESGAHNWSIEGRCWRGCLAVESRGTVADQAVRVAFSPCRPDWPPPQTRPVRDREGQEHYAQGPGPSRRSHVALNSLAAARPVRRATAER